MPPTEKGTTPDRSKTIRPVRELYDIINRCYREGRPPSGEEYAEATTVDASYQCELPI